MYCLRCGRQTPERRVFCDGCLAEMEKYPVKPGAVVHLPVRSERVPVKKPGRKARNLPPEEQVARLRRQNKRLAAAIAALALVICLLGAALVCALLHQEPSKPLGRNYTTVGPGQTTDVSRETPPRPGLYVSRETYALKRSIYG